MDNAKYLFIDPIHISGTQSSDTLDAGWIADNGWSVMLEPWPPTYNGSTLFNSVEETRAVLEPALEVLQSYNIPTKLWLNFCLRWSRDQLWPGIESQITASTPISYYSGAYDASIDDLESRWAAGGTQGDIFNGYWYEGAYDNGAQWLRDATELEIRFGLYSNTWVTRDTPNPYDAAPMDFELRMTLVDGVDTEIWLVNDLFNNNYFGGDMIGCAQYVRENYPEISLGIDSTGFLLPQDNTSSRFWCLYRPEASYPGLDPVPSAAESMRRYQGFLTYFRNCLSKPFDVLCAESNSDWQNGTLPSGATPTYNTWLQYQFSFQDSVGLQQGGATQINLTNIAYAT